MGEAGTVVDETLGYRGSAEEEYRQTEDREDRVVGDKQECAGEPKYDAIPSEERTSAALEGVKAPCFQES